MLSAESERFSEAAGAAAAGCSFFCLAVFFAVLAGASAFEAAASPSWESFGAGTDLASLVFGSSGFGLVGFSGSAIILMRHLNFAGFGFRIAYHAYSLAWALPGPGICRSA